MDPSPQSDHIDTDNSELPQIESRRRLGIAKPRIYTKPLRPLTPESTSGYEVIDWCKSALGWTPLPWQRFLLLHAQELQEDGLPRFRTVLVVAARQQGKSSLITALSLWWLSQGVPLILGTSSSLDTAREVWENAVEFAEDLPDVFGRVKVRRSNGDWQLTVGNRCRYKIAAAGRRGGRGLTAHRVVEDELREHRDFEAHAAADNATLAVGDAQTWMLSNAGDAGSIVLNHFLALGRSGEDPSLGLFEWSAPDGCEITDRHAWRQANPSLGRTITERALTSKLSQPASVFRTENLAQVVAAVNEAVSADAWAACHDPGTLDAHRSRVVVCLDLSPDLQHSTLVAAATLPDGRVRVEVVAAWQSTAEVRASLPGLLARIRPRTFGWFPSGPAAALGTDIARVRNAQGFTVGQTNAICQGLAEFAAAGRVAHNGDPLLAAHVLGAKRLTSGDGWRFSRRDGGHADAAYSAAGAIHLARSLPAPAKLRLITVPENSNR
ncbi:terminase [Dactylosporangium siamense]|uniref:Terminase n=1 Tax=Dactylosporangium siamense TaxID=685454 RepID=A0A919PDW2_9ACTN|nr:terminase [Dactylosporangium siamense]GIG42991.1 hypothetical protein Dsi01nite_010320 [Dactylosporangium siamense]